MNNIKEMDGTQDALINLATVATEDIETMMSQNKTIRRPHQNRGRIDQTDPASNFW